MHIYSKQLSLEEGFIFSDIPEKHLRLIAGKEVRLCAGITLFKALQNQEIKCWKCQARADRWIVSKHTKDLVSKQTLNLYGQTATGRLVLMTRDHVIPKSLGGVDQRENLRPGCEECNSARGNILDSEDAEFMLMHPELIDAERVNSGRKNMMKEILALVDNPEPSAITKIVKPFLKAERILNKHKIL